MAKTISGALESELYKLDGSISHLLHRAEQLAADRFTQLMGEGVTLRQVAVLAAVAATPGMRQSDLVSTTGIDRSTLADMISRMEKRGWIDRTTALLDARAHAVHLAPAGEAILVSASRHARAAEAAILDALPRTKRKALINILTKLAKLADENAAKAERDARRKAKHEAKKKKREKQPKKGKRPDDRKERS